MQDDERKVTTFCPRCGQPIVWSVTPCPAGARGGEQLEVTGYACYCPLDEDEWDDLADEAGDALQDRRHAADRDVRRVREDEPS